MNRIFDTVSFISVPHLYFLIYLSPTQTLARTKENGSKSCSHTRLQARISLPRIETHFSVPLDGTRRNLPNSFARAKRVSRNTSFAVNFNNHACACVATLSAFRGVFLPRFSAISVHTFFPVVSLQKTGAECCYVLPARVLCRSDTIKLACVRYV